VGRFLPCAIAFVTLPGKEWVSTTPGQLELTNKLRNYYGDMELKLQQAGIDVGHVDDYIHRVMEFKKGIPGFVQDLKAGRANIDPMRQKKPGFAKERKLREKKLGEVMELGYKPAEDAIKVTTLYHMEASRTLSTKSLLDFIDENLENFGGYRLQVPRVERIGKKGKPVAGEVGVEVPEGMAVYAKSGRFSPHAPERVEGSPIFKLTKEEGLALGEVSGRDIQALAGSGADLVVLPRELAEYTNRQFQAFSDAGKDSILDLFNGFNSMWKAYALATPGFHVRNGYGGVFQNWISGLSDVRRYWTAGRVTKAIAQGKNLPTDKITIGKTKMGLDELWIEARDLDVVGSGTYFNETLDPVGNLALIKQKFSRKGWKNLTKQEKMAMANPFSRNNIGLQLTRLAGNSVENTLRFSLYMDRRIKGASAFDAAKITQRTHFNYRYGLTPGEAKIRDRLIPFYSWLRFNIPFQLENLYKQPAKYSRIPKAIEALQGVETAQEEEYKPDYFKQLGLFKSPVMQPDDPGYSLYLFPDFPWKDIGTIANLLQPGIKLMQGQEPQMEDFLEVGREIAENLGPIPKAMLEATTGYNFFQRRQIPKKEQVVFPSSLDWLPAQAKEFIGGNEHEAGWTLSRQNANMIETLVPVFARIDRMYPGDQKYTIRHLSSTLSVLLGLKGVVHELERNRRNTLTQRRMEAGEERAVEMAGRRTLRRAKQAPGLEVLFGGERKPYSQNPERDQLIESALRASMAGRR